MKGSVSNISSRQMGLMGSLQVLNLQTFKKQIILKLVQSREETSLQPKYEDKIIL